MHYITIVKFIILTAANFEETIFGKMQDIGLGATFIGSEEI